MIARIPTHSQQAPNAYIGAKGHLESSGFGGMMRDAMIGVEGCRGGLLLDSPGNPLLKRMLDGTS